MSLFPDLLRTATPDELEDLREMFIVADGGELSDLELVGLMQVHFSGGLPLIMKTISGRVIRQNPRPAASWGTTFDNVFQQTVDRMGASLRFALQFGDVSATGILEGEKKLKPIPMEYWRSEYEIDLSKGVVKFSGYQMTFFAVQVRGYVSEDAPSNVSDHKSGAQHSYDITKRRGRPSNTIPFVQAYVNDAVETGNWQLPDMTLARKWFNWGLDKGISRFNKAKQEEPSIDWIRRRLLAAYEDREKYGGNTTADR